MGAARIEYTDGKKDQIIDHGRKYAGEGKKRRFGQQKGQWTQVAIILGCFAIAAVVVILVFNDALHVEEKWDLTMQEVILGGDVDEEWKPTIEKVVLEGNVPKELEPSMQEVVLGGHVKECEGKRIFIYNISDVYNEAFVRDCFGFKKGRDLCMYMKNDGMGTRFEFGLKNGGPMGKANVWYNTWQFSLELYFHKRLLRHPCVTTDENIANVFYVPFYAGMDLSHTQTHRLPKEKLHTDLAAWLRGKKSWKRWGGLDHFITIGRIARDFHTHESKIFWGNQMLLREPFKQMVKLTIERNLAKESNNGLVGNEIAIPYPTYFHASSDSDIHDIVLWVSQTLQRKILVSMAAGKRRGANNFRDKLMTQCGNHPRCTLLICEGHEASRGLQDEIAIGSSRRKMEGHTLSVSCNNPLTLLATSHESEFCLQPPGDSPTRRSFFDAMLAGCIPVIFSKDAAWTQYINHLPEDGSNYSVYIPITQASRSNVVNILSKIGKQEIQRMRSNIAKLLPQILYAHVDRKYPRPFDKLASDRPILSNIDAFDIALDAVFTKIDSNKSGKAHL